MTSQDGSRRILILVDEPHIGELLQHAIETLQRSWTLRVAPEADAVLPWIQHEAVDVFVTDMPAAVSQERESLLGAVRNHWPATARIVLLDPDDHADILRRAGAAHRFLSQPCDPSALTAAIGETLAVRDALHDSTLQALVSRVQSLPSLPTLYLRLIDELNRRAPSVPAISRIVEQDVAIAAKLLQLVNSAYFGRPGRTSDLQDAVRFLGLENLQALMLGAHVFSSVHTVSRYFKPNVLWQHSLAVSVLARDIARAQHAPEEIVTASLTAGLLHDCGKILLASMLPWEFDAMTLRARRDGLSLWQVERETLGCTHAEVGAYLLGLWGLPDPIVGTVAFHHRPSESSMGRFDALTAVHAANAILTSSIPDGHVDWPYLDALGLTPAFDTWRRLIPGTSAAAGRG